MIQDQIKHLSSRAAFGIVPQGMRNAKTINDAIASLFPKTKPEEIKSITLKEYLDIKSNVVRAENKTGNETKTRTLHDARRDLNAHWLQEMVDTPYPLREIMAVFWHGHFATKIVDPFMNQQMVQILRTHALGSFKDMLHATSRSAIMLYFLNNKQNVKAKPNENFAREVMELFTLGIGNYKEKDIQEAARAFTGWSFDKDNNFIFRENQHDTGSKTFFGKTGNYDGNDILNILLEQKQTARYVSGKLCRYFVGESAIPAPEAEKLAMQFYDSDYDISALLKSLFSASWFYDASIIGNRIKSPIEVIVGMRRTIPVHYDPDTKWVQLQTLLGQELFMPPNVAGWPGGKAWPRGSALPVRLKLAEALYASAEIQFTEDANDENTTKMMAGAKRQKTYSLGKAAVDWTGYISRWKDVPQEQLPQAIAEALLPKLPSAEKLAVIKRFADKDTREEYIKSTTILIMKMPEYQLS